MTAQELLENLNLVDEHERVEAKSAQEVGRSLLETICAFANEPGLGGGWILLGVQRQERSQPPAYEVIGLAQPDEVSTDLASQCASMFNAPLRVDYRTESLQGETVAVVFVQEAQANDKPVFLKAQGLPRGAYRRIGSSDQRCTEDDMLLFYQGRQAESYDAGLVADTALEDLLPEALDDYRKSRAAANPDAEELGWSDEDLLQAVGAVRRNKEGRWQPTVAGLMLFGKPTALRRCFPMTRVDYIRVPGREWVPDPESRFDSLELRDPLFRLIRRTQTTILDDLPKAFGLAEGQLQRQDKPVIPQRVIREALVNALMHRSYRSHSPVQIIRYANRLEIRNPGFSLKSPEHLGEPGSSPRNPKIASVLHETRFAETKGSGIRVMRDMTEAAGLTPPLFESDRTQDQFVALFFFHHLLGEHDLRWLARFRELNLSEAEARALVVAREANAMDNATYRSLNKMDSLTASTALRRLRDVGLFEQQGRGSATWYKPTAKLLGIEARSTPTDDLFSPPLEVQDSELLGLSSKPHPLSSNPVSLSSDLSTLSGNLVALAPKLPDLHVDQLTHRWREGLVAGLPATVASRLAQIGKRHPPQKIRELVVDLCEWQPWRAEELALLIRRRAETVRQDYLRPLLAEGRIVMTRPEKPNDPQQAYRTAERPR